MKKTYITSGQFQKFNLEAFEKKVMIAHVKDKSAQCLPERSRLVNILYPPPKWGIEIDIENQK